MTREQIIDGLTLLVLHLANDADVPDGWEPHLWAYLKGLASGELLRLRDRLSAIESSTGNVSATPPPVGDV